jgi:hypothetical protein
MSELMCASRVVPDAVERLRRYCGLAWEGGPAEVWAYPYFDAVETEGDVIDPVDVVSCAALHPALSRSDLEFFAARRFELEAWVAGLPPGVGLGAADASVMGRLRGLPLLAEGVGVSLLSKVLHRKRPMLVPMLDHDIVDWYRPVTGRRGVSAWPAVVDALHADLAETGNIAVLANTAATLEGCLRGPVPSSLRMVDIAIWMGGRP